MAPSNGMHSTALVNTNNPPVSFDCRCVQQRSKEQSNTQHQEVLCNHVQNRTSLPTAASTYGVEAECVSQKLWARQPLHRLREFQPLTAGQFARFSSVHDSYHSRKVISIQSRSFPSPSPSLVIGQRSDRIRPPLPRMLTSVDGPRWRGCGRSVISPKRAKLRDLTMIADRASNVLPLSTDRHSFCALHSSTMSKRHDRKASLDVHYKEDDDDEATETEPEDESDDESSIGLDPPDLDGEEHDEGGASDTNVDNDNLLWLPDTPVNVTGGKPSAIGSPVELKIRPRLFTETAQAQLYDALHASGIAERPFRPALASEKEWLKETKKNATAIRKLRKETPEWHAETLRALCYCARKAKATVPKGMQSRMIREGEPEAKKLYFLGLVADNKPTYTDFVNFLEEELTKETVEELRRAVWDSHKAMKCSVLNMDEADWTPPKKKKQWAQILAKPCLFTSKAQKFLYEVLTVNNIFETPVPPEDNVPIRSEMKKLCKDAPSWPKEVARALLECHEVWSENRPGEVNPPKRLVAAKQDVKNLSARIWYTLGPPLESEENFHSLCRRVRKKLGSGKFNRCQEALYNAAERANKKYNFKKFKKKEESKIGKPRKQSLASTTAKKNKEKQKKRKANTHSAVAAFSKEANQKVKGRNGGLFSTSFLGGVPGNDEDTNYQKPKRTKMNPQNLKSTPPRAVQNGGPLIVSAIPKKKVETVAGGNEKGVAGNNPEKEGSHANPLTLDESFDEESSPESLALSPRRLAMMNDSAEEGENSAFV